MNKIDLSWFNPILDKWLVEHSGPKPTAAMLEVPLLLGKRPGVEALHIAMCLRKAGCTVREFQVAGSCGAANNYRIRLVKAGLMDVTVDGKPYAYKLTVTDKGKKAIADAKAKLKALSKPVKRVRKAKATPVAPEPENAPVAVSEPMAA